MRRRGRSRVERGHAPMRGTEKAGKPAPDPKTVDELFRNLVQVQGMTAAIRGCCDEGPRGGVLRCSADNIDAILWAVEGMLETVHERARTLLL